MARTCQPQTTGRCHAAPSRPPETSRAPTGIALVPNGPPSRSTAAAARGTDPFKPAPAESAGVDDASSPRGPGAPPRPPWTPHEPARPPRGTSSEPWGGTDALVWQRKPPSLAATCEAPLNPPIPSGTSSPERQDGAWVGSGGQAAGDGRGGGHDGGSGAVRGTRRRARRRTRPRT